MNALDVLPKLSTDDLPHQLSRYPELLRENRVGGAELGASPPYFEHVGRRQLRLIMGLPTQDGFRVKVRPVAVAGRVSARLGGTVIVLFGRPGRQVSRLETTTVGDVPRGITGIAKVLDLMSVRDRTNPLHVRRDVDTEAATANGDIAIPIVRGAGPQQASISLSIATAQEAIGDRLADRRPHTSARVRIATGFGTELSPTRTIRLPLVALAAVRADQLHGPTRHGYDGAGHTAEPALPLFDGPCAGVEWRATLRADGRDGTLTVHREASLPGVTPRAAATAPGLRRAQIIADLRRKSDSSARVLTSALVGWLAGVVAVVRLLGGML